MKRILLAAAAAVLVAPALQAQSPVKISLAAGASVPQGDLADFAGMGYQAQGSVGIAFPMTPFALRADVAYSRFGFKDDAMADFTAGCSDLGWSCSASGNMSVLSGGLNAIVSMPGVVVRPYLIAGGGMYRQKGTVDLSASDSNGDPVDLGETDTEAETRPGVSGGLGLQFSLLGRGAYVEARYVNVFNKKDSEGNASHTRYVPVMIGIQF